MQPSVSSVRRTAKHTLKEFEKVSEVSNTSWNTGIHIMVISQDSLAFSLLPSELSSLSYSLISPQTSCGGGCILALCVFVPVS